MEYIYLAFVLFNLILSTALASTPHSSFAIRVIAVGAAGALLTYTQIAIPALDGNRLIKGLLVTPFWLLLTRAVYLIFLPREHHVPVDMRSSMEIHRSLLQRAATSLLNLWAFRTIPRLKKKIPSLSDTDKSYVPSRTSFLAATAMKFAASWLILELSYVAPPPEIQAAFTARHEKTLSRLGEISGEEAATRIFTFVFGGMGSWAIFTGFYSASALIFVGCNLSNPSEWPPLFGSLRDAYSLRRFWGLTWHQTFRMPLEESSEFIVSRTLHIPERTLISRCLKVFFAFWLSGLAHFLSDIAKGIPPKESGSILFFTLQAPALFFEGIVQTLYRRSSFLGRWAYWIGYAWVILFLLWTSPGWLYPSVRYARPGTDFMLPYRFLS